jgi:hypothetical protein
MPCRSWPFAGVAPARHSFRTVHTAPRCGVPGVQTFFRSGQKRARPMGPSWQIRRRRHHQCTLTCRLAPWGFRSLPPVRSAGTKAMCRTVHSGKKCGVRNARASLRSRKLRSRRRPLCPASQSFALSHHRRPSPLPLSPPGRGVEVRGGDAATLDAGALGRWQHPFRCSGSLSDDLQLGHDITSNKVLALVQCHLAISQFNSPSGRQVLPGPH